MMTTMTMATSVVGMRTMAAARGRTVVVRCRATGGLKKWAPGTRERAIDARGMDGKRAGGWRRRARLGAWGLMMSRFLRRERWWRRGR